MSEPRAARLLVASVVASFFLLPCPRALADDATEELAGVRTSISTLDDRANAAWLYGVQTLDFGYDGPSLRESIRALRHGAELLVAADRAIFALGEHHTEAAAILLEGRQALVLSLCGDDAEILDGADLAQHASEFARTCETTSSLIEALIDFVSYVHSTLEALSEEAESCEFSLRIDASQFRNAIRQARALEAQARSCHSTAERREIVHELLGAIRATRASDDGPSYIPSMHGYEAMFERPRLDRYAVSVARVRSTAGARAALAEFVASAHALVRSRDPLAAELTMLGRDRRTFEGALQRWREGASRDSIACQLSGLGHADTLDIAEVLLERLAASRCADGLARRAASDMRCRPTRRH